MKSPIDVFTNQYFDVLGTIGPPLNIEDLFSRVTACYESIVRCMPGNVYWVDKDGCGVVCNDNVLRTFGLTNIQQFKGLSFEDMSKLVGWSDEITKKFKQDTLEVIATGQPKLNLEEPPVIDYAGNTIYFLTSRVPLRNTEGIIIGAIGISVDITERKQLEEKLLQEKKKSEIANRAKTAFLEHMRHDIRTPLSGIVGAATALKNVSNPEQVNQYVNILIQSSQELLRFLNEILETVNVASGEIPLVERKFVLRDILKSLIHLNNAKALEKKLTLNFQFDEKIPEYIISDPIRIYRIILELLVNALKFTNEGSVTLFAKLEHKTERDIIINLMVEDTGPGIPVEKRKELFLRFNRLSPSYQGICRGVGLGLSVVKHFIEDLKGEIYVDSASDRGVKFTCLLPVKEALVPNTVGVTAFTETELGALFPAIEPMVAPIPELERLPTVHRKERLLMVEDNTTITNLQKKILADLGYAVDVALDGRTAIELAKQNFYVAIFMDIGLPDMLGDEVTRILRGMKKYHKTPIFGLTAHADLRKQQESLHAGMDQIIFKPLTEEMAHDLLEASGVLASGNFSILPEVPILDVSMAQKALGENQKFLNEILKIFSENFMQDQQKLKTVYEQADWYKMRVIVCRFKNMSHACGASRLYAVCEQLDMELMSGVNKASRNKLYHMMLSEMEVLREEVESKGIV